MELKDMVTQFATETFTDAFAPATTFTGKINPFAEVTNSGSSSQRRILETPVDQVIPASRVVVSPSGEKLIVADSNDDYWHGEAIRKKYPTLPVDTLGAVGTVGEFLAGAPGDPSVYAYPFSVRSEFDEESSSDYWMRYELHFPKVKSFSRTLILQLGADYYRLKSGTWVDGAGFAVALGILLEAPVQMYDIQTKGGVYDAVTDAYSSGTVPDVSCFVEPLRQDYEFVRPAYQRIEPGDTAISVLKSDVILSTGDLIGDYQIISIREFSTWYTCQCRNKG